MLGAWRGSRGAARRSDQHSGDHLRRYTDMEDVRRLCGARTVGIAGAITGRAIYEGTLDFGQGRAGRRAAIQGRDVGTTGDGCG